MPWVLNMQKLWIWQGSQYVGINMNMPEYVCLDRVVNMSQVLNMPGFWVLQGYEYGCNMSE